MFWSSTFLMELFLELFFLIFARLSYPQATAPAGWALAILFTSRLKIHQDTKMFGYYIQNPNLFLMQHRWKCTWYLSSTLALTQLVLSYFVRTTILISITSFSLNILFNPRQILSNPGIHPWIERVCTSFAPRHHTYQWVVTTSLHGYQGTCTGGYSINHRVLSYLQHP